MRKFSLVVLFSLLSYLTMAQIDLSRKIDFDVVEVSVARALILLSEEANISIAFQSSILSHTDLISIHGKQASIASILEQCLLGTGVGYKVDDAQILLYKKAGRKHTISGYIKDGESGERLVLANIINTKTGRSTTSNDYGYYSLEVPEGNVTLVGGYIGYEGGDVTINLRRDTTINLEMDPYLTLDAVTVMDSEINTTDRRFKIGQGQMVIADDIDAQPALAGETDIYRYLQSQGGVQSGSDGLGGLYVRGGNAEHNLVLLDGVPVFNPSHSLGLFSIFNSNTIKSVRFVKEGFSAQYGGRLASVVDVRTREGNTTKSTGELEIGTIATKGVIEIPIAKHKSALLISGRRTHIDPFLKQSSRKRKAKELNEGEYNYSFFDLNAKFHSEIGAKSKLYLSYYRGQDDFEDLTSWDNAYEDVDTGEEFDQSLYLDQQLGWSNEISSFRWNQVIGKSVFANLTGTYSRYNYASLNEYIYADSGDPEEPYYANVADSRSQVIDYGLQLSIDHYVSPRHQLKYGGEVLFRAFIPSSYTLTSEMDEIDVESFITSVDSIENFLSYTATEYSVYIEDKIMLGDATTLMLGLRATAFEVTNKTYLSILPRVSLAFDIDDHWSGRLSTAQSVQYLHVLSSSDAGLPTDLWVPATDTIGPQEAWQYSAGLTNAWGDGWSIDMGAYYKSMTGLLSYGEETKQPGLAETDPTYWQELVSVGTGASYGLELSVTKSKGKNRGSLNYTYSKSERQFEDVNGGDRFPFSFDRPHSINVQYAHYFSPKVNLQLGWQYSSGRPITLQRTESRFVALSNTFDNSSEPSSGTNAHRLADYHRLDINLQLKLGSGSTRHLLNLGVYNAYNRNNAYYEYLLTNDIEDVTGSSSTERLRSLPLLPSVSYKVEFGR